MSCNYVLLMAVVGIYKPPALPGVEAAHALTPKGPLELGDRGSSASCLL